MSRDRLAASVGRNVCNASNVVVVRSMSVQLMDSVCLSAVCLSTCPYISIFRTTVPLPRYWDVSSNSAVLWVETIRRPRAEGCGPPDGANNM